MKDKIFTLDAIRRRSRVAYRGYMEDVLLTAKRLPDGRYSMSEDEFQAIRKKVHEHIQKSVVRRGLKKARERLRKGSVGLTKVALGIDRSTDELIEARKAVCEQCEHLKKGTCELCGCRYRQKIKLASEKCPAQKW